MRVVTHVSCVCVGRCESDAFLSAHVVYNDIQDPINDYFRFCCTFGARFFTFFYRYVSSFATVAMPSTIEKIIYEVEFLDMLGGWISRRQADDIHSI